MPTIKQKTVNGQTYELKQYKTNKPNHQYEYYVTEDGGRVEDPVYTREAGMRQFRETIRLVKKGEKREAQRGGFPGIGGGGGGGEPSLPGIGAPFDDDDDDDGPSLPFL